LPFAASYDRTTKIISIVVCLGFLAVIVAVHNIVLTSLSVLILVVAYAYSPRGYVLADRSILVKRMAGAVRVPLGEIREARRASLDDFRGCVRLWGSGGLFGYYGLFTTDKLGKCTWYVTNRSKGVVVITGAKTVLFSPDEPDGFLDTIRTYAPVSVSSALLSASSAPLSFEPGRPFGAIGKMIAAAVALAGIGLAVFAITYSPGVPTYTLTPEALTIHDRFYPVTLPASAINVDQIRIVDLTGDTSWRPIARTNGFANSHYRSGWFKTASGGKVRLYRADGQRVVLIPPRGDSAPVLYQAANPEKFVDEIRAQWNTPPHGGSNAGK
jgi:hypothetical protein